MNKKGTLGFTLIELLIVIAIIGILAVAFLPSILGAPAKGRDTARIADLQKIQKVLVNADLEGKSMPATGCVTDGFGDADSDYFLKQFSGKLPADQQAENTDGSCTGEYSYFNLKADDPSLGYSFGLQTHVELLDNANAICGDAESGALTAPTVDDPAEDLCYVILNQ